jgi:cytochrome c peroxidase
MDLAVQAVEALQAELDTGPVELLRAIRQAPDLARQYEVLAQDRSLPRPACLVGDKAETEACRGEQAFGLAALGLAAFERTINAEDSDFDRFVRTLKAQPHTAERPLDANALRGLQLFVGAAGCITCHNGPYLSDGEFHAIGIPPFETALHPDPGRRAGVETLKGVSTMDRWAWIVPAEKRASYEELRHYLSLADGLWGEFRTPSLRNVAYTAPYMHNGRLRTLEEVLDYYNSGGLNIGGSKWEPHRDDHNETIIRPLGLTDGERQDIIAFLRSLSSHPNPENRSSCVITR